MKKAWGMSAPECLSSSVRRLWLDVSPFSYRAAQVKRKVLCANLPIIKEHEGKLVPDLGNRKENR